MAGGEVAESEQEPSGELELGGELLAKEETEEVEGECSLALGAMPAGMSVLIWAG